MNTDTYYPLPESKGGWRYLIDPDEVRELAGMDPDKLDLMAQQQEWLYGSELFSIVIIRHGYLVREYNSFIVLIPTRFDIWSGTKEFTGTAWGLLLEDSRQGRLPNDQQVNLDSPVYNFIPEGYPLTDPRKERMTIRHLLTLTSSLPGGDQGIFGIPTATNVGPFEHALGFAPNRHGLWCDKLLGEPGTIWSYSDPGWAHLSLAFANIMGREMDDYMQERIFDPIGIEHLSWDVQGGSGFIGPHTNAHTGLLISSRELARFGYLMLQRGKWKGEQLIPEWWIDLATQPSQDLNPQYGYTWWVNPQDKHIRWPGLPVDAFGLSGHRNNWCIIIPSLDMVIVRTGTGPSLPDFMPLNRIVDAISE